MQNDWTSNLIVVGLLILFFAAVDAVYWDVFRGIYAWIGRIILGKTPERNGGDYWTRFVGAAVLWSPIFGVVAALVLLRIIR